LRAELSCPVPACVLPRRDLLVDCGPTIEQRLESLVALELFGARPGLGGSAAPGRLNQTDGLSRRFLNLAAKEVRDRRKVLDRFRSTNAPFAFGVGQRLLGDNLLLDLEEADLGMLGIRDLFLGIRR